MAEFDFKQWEIENGIISPAVQKTGGEQQFDFKRWQAENVVRDQSVSQDMSHGASGSWEPADG
jgi:hypothetical protein